MEAPPDAKHRFPWSGVSTSNPLPTPIIRMDESSGTPIILDEHFFWIQFQHGPVKEVGVNGCEIEDILAVLIERVKGFEAGPMSCPENAGALTAFEVAQDFLNARTKRREAQGIEGYNKPHES